MRSIGAAAGLLATALMAAACNGSDEPPPGGSVTPQQPGGTTASPPQGGISTSPPGASIGSSPGSGQTPPATGEGCNPAPAQFAIGRVATPALIESARQAAGARLVRVLRPDMAVTQEYSPDRLNVLVDEGGVVREVTCW
ncbi:peptidase inhibitor I78 family protein [Tepidamorphus gemmatus]|uniref:Peptidase inhibitor I78 family protein n=1 Tax=Tepidamorphus gemmatus TaxID=747076 RepID=A0A4R3LVH0_9HYPH|nr:I78 family peptidase inhibitor [Tepidamorphus gemmatus]TCT04562.1 peptidase inhibitor I78 family protein [Tepidamorphus gemmatus]